MKTNVYTIYDKLARESGPLYQAKNDAVAYRQFCTQLKEIKNINEDDFELLNIAEYDNEECQLQNMITITVDIAWLAYLELQPQGNVRQQYQEYLETLPKKGGANNA